MVVTIGCVGGWHRDPVYYTEGDFMLSSGHILGNVFRQCFLLVCKAAVLLLQLLTFPLPQHFSLSHFISFDVLYPWVLCLPWFL